MEWGVCLDQLVLLGQGVVGEIEMVMYFEGNCVHDKGFDIGRVTGDQRDKQRKEVRLPC